jgi:hypothetical protein
MVVAPIVKGLDAMVDLSASCTRFRTSNRWGKEIGGQTQNSTLKKLSRDDNDPFGGPFKMSRTPCATGAYESGGEYEVERDTDRKGRTGSSFITSVCTVLVFFSNTWIRRSDLQFTMCAIKAKRS